MARKRGYEIPLRKVTAVTVQHNDPIPKLPDFAANGLVNPRKPKKKVR